MRLSGWGRYPVVDGQVVYPPDARRVVECLSSDPGQSSIARGLGRSYGDSALAGRMLGSRALSHFISFDASSGELVCEAGVVMADVLEVFVPRGWFPPVTPGTRFVTIGGAVASDVHGKNHHMEGSFSDHVSALKVATVTDGIVECSRHHHPELFHATCGGMGLTGFIVEVAFGLKRIVGAGVKETTMRARNLARALELFDEHAGATYSVAWIDCLARGNSLGRSLVMVGEHAETGRRAARDPGLLAVPFDMPGFLLNRWSVRAFNALYYRRIRGDTKLRTIHYDPFFYPLDGVGNWNRLYGSNGFVQYQFVLPRAGGAQGMREILTRIVGSQRGSFLAVLKLFGPGNDNPLSFPVEGYTLALDFKLNAGLLMFLDELDRVVLDYGGRIYLTKDARMSKGVFRHGYPRWREFMEARSAWGADRVFHSLQSRRLGL